MFINTENEMPHDVDANELTEILRWNLLQIIIDVPIGVEGAGEIKFSFQRGNDIRSICFRNISALSIDKGYRGDIQSLEIIPMRKHQWSNVSYEICNTKQDPGIAFYADEMQILSA